MTKRKLNKQEAEMCEKGIKKVENDLIEIKENMEYNDKTVTFQKIQAIYQESVKPYLQKKKEQEERGIMGMLKEKLTQTEEHLKRLQDQLKDGVDEKSTK